MTPWRFIAGLLAILIPWKLLAWIVGLILILGILAVVAFWVIFAGVFGNNGGFASIAASEFAISQIPADQQLLFQQTAQQSSCNLPWTLVASVAKHESDFGRNPNMYVAHDNGILGYGQFDPATWLRYGYGRDIFSPKDGIAAIDRYLCALGAGTDPLNALEKYTGCVRGTRKPDGSLCNRTDTFPEDYLALSAQYGLVIPTGGISTSCTFGPSNPNDFNSSLISDFGVTLLGYDATHLQWAWEEFCNISATRFNSYVRGARVQISSLGDSRQVACTSGSTSVLLGPFPDKVTFQVALTHELGHVIFNCRVKGTPAEAVFRRAHMLEGGISYYAQHAQSCTGSDPYSEDSADTITYNLNPGMKRSMLKCEIAAGVLNAPDLSKFSLHVAWAHDLLGGLSITTTPSITPH